MSKRERARRIRDMILGKAGLSLEESLDLGSEQVLVSEHAWQARIGSVRRPCLSMPVRGAGRLDLSVNSKKVAILAWSQEELWVSALKRGPWESIYFNQAPYRTSAERWMEICSRPPEDLSVFLLMAASQRESTHRAMTEDSYPVGG